MNKFKKYLSEHPDAAARFEKTGSVAEKDSKKSTDTTKNSGQKQDAKKASRLP